MHISPDSLPVNVKMALERGHTIEAIKLLRESTGLGLKEAKDIVDEFLRRRPPVKAVATAAESLPASVADALAAGNKIEAIKRMRELTGMGLKEAKDAVEGFTPPPQQPASDGAAQGGNAADGLSPGEMRKSKGMNWWMVAAAIVAIVAYYFIGLPG